MSRIDIRLSIFIYSKDKFVLTDYFISYADYL